MVRLGNFVTAATVSVSEDSNIAIEAVVTVIKLDESCEEQQMGSNVGLILHEQRCQCSSIAADLITLVEGFYYFLDSHPD